MSDESDPRRDAIHERIQELGPPDMEKHAVLVGWVIVCDWMDEDGERWLSKGQRWLSKGHSSSIPTWTAEGMHHEALYGDWPSACEDDEE